MRTDDQEVIQRSLKLKQKIRGQIDKILLKNNLTVVEVRYVLALLSAARTFDKAIKTYEQASESYHNADRVTNIYGRGRKLQVVRWTTATLAGKSVMDFGEGRTWISEGIPDSASIVAVAIETAPVIAASNFCVILEDSTFKELDWDEIIPELKVLTVNVQKNMDIERDKHSWT